MNKQITVNLMEYPEFWRNFAARGAAFDPSSMITPEQFEYWMMEWYGLSVKVVPGLTIGTVVISEPDYTAFLLKWS